MIGGNMKILVLSISPWRDDNSVGNTLSNIFKNFPNAEFANIYLKPGKPDNDICFQYYQINEKMLLQRKMGEYFALKENEETEHAVVMSQQESVIYDFFRKKRYTILFLLREFIWKYFWKASQGLDVFLQNFKPDIIFLLLNNTVYSNKLAMHVKKKTNIPMVAYAWDDVYSYQGKNPLKFFYQMLIRKAIREVVRECSHLYAISTIQKQEYSTIFRKPCKLLWKGMSFEQKPFVGEKTAPLKMVYTGNVSGGRWEVLAEIGKALNKINMQGKKAELYIYTLTPMTKKMRKGLSIPNTLYLCGGVSSDKIEKIQNAADILVHVESFRKKYTVGLRQSFSTKLVDYMARGKCIFAVGPSNVASIDYLKNNDAAVVADSNQTIMDNLLKICEETKWVEKYSEKSWQCGKRNHQIGNIQAMLNVDFKELIDENRTN